MVNLLKTDLKRIIKDKLFLIICIIGAVMAVSTPLMNKLLMDSIESITSVEEEGLFVITAKSLFFDSFSVTSNFGLLLPIFVTIILFKDFSHGTIRNKIICGKSRLKIFFSMFLSSFIVIAGVLLLQALISLLFSLLFFKYTNTGGTSGSEFAYFIESIAFILINYIFVAALVSFFCVFMKHAGTAIVCFVAVNIFLSTIPVLLDVYASILEEVGTKKELVSFLNFLIDTNVYNNLDFVIGKGTSYTSGQVLKILFPPLIFSTGLVALSILRFKRKDIK